MPHPVQLCSVNVSYMCYYYVLCNKRIIMFRDRGVGWPSVGDQYGSRGKMQATNQHSGALLRGRKGKGGNKGINMCSLFVSFDILTCLIRNLMFSVLLF